MQVTCEKKLKTEIKDSRKVADQEVADALGTQIVVGETKETRAEKRRRILNWKNMLCLVEEVRQRLMII